MTVATLGTIGEQALEKRCISPETAVRYGVYTGRSAGEGRVEPDAHGNVIVFPFIDRDQVVGEKYRAPNKRFWQREGGRKTFWNADALDDPLLATGHQALVITEGEIDALTAIDCGFPLTVSVPDGAPAVPKGRDPTDLDPLDESADASGKFEYVFNNRDRLKRVQRFILAVDNDGPGQRLAAELVRRFSAAKCLFVTYPDGCKDLNDVRMKLGAEVVARVLNEAKPYPVKGLYRLDEFPEAAPIRTYQTGWQTLDLHLKPFLGEIMFVLGIPGHGKSAFVTNLLVNLSERYGWRVALFGPEEPTVPHQRDKLRRMHLRQPPLELDRASIAKADAWINDRFVFIAADPSGMTEQELCLEWIIEKAIDAVYRYGIQVLVIDPWNEVEHARKAQESQTEYIGRAIRMLNKFRHQYGVMVIVLIHPTKDVGQPGKDGRPRTLSPYDADGSAHWYNKADHFVIISRPGDGNESTIRVAKCKFEGTGERGHVTLKFDKHSGRFEMLAPLEDMR